MRILTENGLKCFLDDLRNELAFLKNELPKDIHFISADSFYFYLNLAYPIKCQQVMGLMTVLEPYIPLVVSEKGLNTLMNAYAQNDLNRLTDVEQSLAARSKLLFLNSAITTDEDNWSNVVDVCCALRRLM
ncbi:MAG: hypothetical protein FWE33_04815 [Defluviitaleaceae bacterium]|nr:hypothetical protein [Defluviitaleaceae bacterium]